MACTSAPITSSYPTVYTVCNAGRQQCLLFNACVSYTVCNAGTGRTFSTPGSRTTASIQRRTFSTNAGTSYTVCNAGTSYTVRSEPICSVHSAAIPSRYNGIPPAARHTNSRSDTNDSSKS